jgi:hypothetical protein
MRRLVFCLVLFLVTISAATGVHAATDCEKWLNEYKNSLAHSPAAHRVQAAHHRLHRYVHRKLARLKPKPKTTPKPKPRLLPARHTKPKMTREEMLRKLDLACGDLPEEQPELAMLKGDPAPEFVPEESDDTNPIELASDDGGFLQTLPPVPYTGVPEGGYPGAPGFPFAPPMGGGGGRIPNSPTTGTTVVDTPPAPPTAEAPEPGSYVLLFTGLSGIAGIVRRRRTS